MNTCAGCTGCGLVQTASEPTREMRIILLYLGIPLELQADLTAVNPAHAHVVVCACTFWEDFIIHCT